MTRAVALASVVTCLAPVAPKTNAAEAVPPTRAGVLEALATKEREIPAQRTRLDAAAAASDRAAAAFAAADGAMREAVAAEVGRNPYLRGLEQLFYVPGLSALLAAQLPALRANLADARRGLDRVKREEDNRRLMGDPRPADARPWLEYVVALGDMEVRAHQLLAPSLERIEPARALREKRLGEMRDRVAELKSAEDALRLARQERLRLMHRLATELRPVYLRSVGVSVAGGPPASVAWSYRAVVSEIAGAGDLDRDIAFLLAALADAQPELERHRREVRDAEARFAEVGRRLDRAHAENVRLTRSAYRLRATLELADSAIGIIKDRGQPAGIFFEAGWRVIEYARTDSYRIEEPRIDEALAAYREDVSRRLGDLAAVPDRPEMLSDEEWLARHCGEILGQGRAFATTEERFKSMRSEQADEFIKGTVNVAVVDGVRLFARAAIAQGWKPESFKQFLNSSLFTERFDAAETLKRWAQKGADTLPLPAGIAEWLRGGDATGEVLRNRRSAWAQASIDKLKDFALSAAVTAAKEFLTARQRDEMMRVATELALIDVEWFLRRYEYTVRGATYRAFGRRLAEVEAAVGALLEQREREVPARALTVEADETLATTDPLRLRLEFSGPVDEARVSAGQQQFTERVNGRTVVELFVPPGAFAAGTLTLAITARRGGGNDSGFDSDPTTVARYDAAVASTSPAARYVGYERDADRRHRLRFDAPSLTIRQPKGPYLSGDMLDVAYHLPPSLARRRIHLKVYPQFDQPSADVDVPADSVDGTMPFRAPARPGKYRLLLLPGRSGEPMAGIPLAETSFTVVMEVVRAPGAGACVEGSTAVWEGNGHSYELVQPSTGMTWAQARDAAAGRSCGGAKGHLVTITSAAENAFLVKSFRERFGGFAWIGASDSAQEGQWRWVVGPESGTALPGARGSGASSGFGNWGPVEPNNDGDEDVAALNLGGPAFGGTDRGQWGDTNGSVTLTGYLVEYSGARRAEANLIVNGSFEEGPAMSSFFHPLNPGSRAVSGWQVIKGQVDVVSGASAEGSRHMDLDGTAGFGGVEQLFPTEAGRSYRLRFQASANAGAGPAVKVLEVRVGGVVRTYRIANGEPWKVCTVDFTASSASTTVQFTSLDTEGGYAGPILDDVAVSSVAAR